MKPIIRTIKRYSFFILMVLAFAVLFAVLPQTAVQATALSWDNLLEMLKILPPIFILLGLLDVWVPRETIIRLTGDRSGARGMLLSFLLGSFAAGPLYAAFPVAAVMIKKGSRFSNVLILVGAWSTAKIPLLLFEAGAMGWTFMLVRLAINIPMILGMAVLIEKMVSREHIQNLYQRISDNS